MDTEEQLKREILRFQLLKKRVENQQKKNISERSCRLKEYKLDQICKLVEPVLCFNLIQVNGNKGLGFFTASELERVESPQAIAHRFEELKSNFNMDDVYLILPFDWQGHGGVVVTAAIFFENYDLFLWCLEDGVYFVRKGSLVLSIRGERNGDALDYIEVGLNKGS